MTEYPLLQMTLTDFSPNSDGLQSVKEKPSQRIELGFHHSFILNFGSATPAWFGKNQSLLSKSTTRHGKHLG
jgi:hypothetical protein